MLIISLNLWNNAGPGVRLGYPMAKKFTPLELLLHVGLFGKAVIKLVSKESASKVLLLLSVMHVCSWVIGQAFIWGDF